MNRPSTRSGKSRAAAIARGAGLAALLGLGLTAGCRDRELEAQAAATCAAVDAEKFDEALALSQTGSSATGAGRELAQCRCVAFLSTGNRDACTALLDPLLRTPEAADWVPHPVLTKLMLRTWRSAGEIAPAAELAARAASIHRDDLDLLQLELMLRSASRDEAELLADRQWRAEALVSRPANPNLRGGI